MKRAGLLGRALLIYAVALALRLRNVRGVFLGDRVLFGYDDPYYHLRRIILTLQHFPRVPAFDSYTNFPDGAVITWPPGFDLLVSLVCWVAGLGHPTHHRVEVAAALFVPILGAATAVVVLLLGEEIFGRARWEALAAAALFAFLPAQQAISTVGRLDHHVVEMSAFGMALLFFLRGLRDDPGSRYSFWGGVALAAGTFCWTGSILFAGFLTFFALGQMALDRVHGRTESSAGRSALRILFWGAVLLVPLVLVAPGNGKREFTYLLLSWYQPALLGAAAFVVPALSEVIFAAGRRRAVLRASSGAVATTLLLVAAGWILRRGTGGFQFLSRRDRVISLLVESNPVWELPQGQLVEYFSPLLYAAPLAAALLLRDVFRDRFHDVRMNALLALLAFTALLGVSQARFLNYFAVPFCLVLLWALRRGVEALLRRVRKPVFRWCVSIACALLFLAPLGPLLRASVHSLPGNVDPALARIYPSLEWMRDKTPSTSFFLDPDQKPEYGVLADFSFGHWITVIGRRPNFCNPFSLAPWHEKPIFESARIFLAEQEPAALEALDRNQLRYILLYNNENALHDYSFLLDESPEAYLRKAGPGAPATPTVRFFRTLGVRLALTDGTEHVAAGETIPALQGFRLVHESPETRPRRVPGLEGSFESSYVKIFERVKGAVLVGTVAPGSEIFLRTDVTTNTSRVFTYRTRTTAAADGSFRFVVPYATEVSGEVSATPVLLEGPGCKVEVALGEVEVVSGATHPVRCRR